jgi:probable O-glycosylation ligase (exosortase A-associated)
MRDLALVGFLLALIAFGFKRPFLFVLAYAYVDIVAPQRLSYYLLNSVPLSLIVAALAMLAWLLVDSKRDFRASGRQLLMLALLVYAGITTLYADVPVHAGDKWSWVWKSMIWAIFLPFALRTRLRIEAYLLFMILSAAAIVIVGAIKTLFSGGGYGALNLMVEQNSGLYEGSTISMVAIAAVPLILWLARFGTIFPGDWRVRLFAYALVFACLLIPIGTQARTGLICIAALVFLMLREVKRRAVYMVALAAVLAIAIPLMPQSYTTRMSTISTYQADLSATTRLAVWEWTWDYAKRNPFGGGFDAYRLNRISVRTVETAKEGAVQTISEDASYDAARAYHSSYFEMLGEQGFPGLILFLLLHAAGLFRMEVLRRRHAGAQGDQAWISPLATALQNGQIVYLVGALFIGVAWQSFILMLLAVQIGFDTYVSHRKQAETRRPFRSPPPGLKSAPADA